MKRRDFIKTATLAAGAGLVPTLAAEQAESYTAPTIKKKNRLGRTGLVMSDISFGGGKLSTPMLMARAVEMGINYFDTAPDYGPSESTIGDYLMKAGGRDKLILASKFCSREIYPAHLSALAKERDYIEAVEGSLERMNTDYLDIVFVHAMGEPSREYEERLLSQEMLNAFAKLKKAGKARFLAVSSHGPNRMEELLMKAVKSGHYDVIMPSFNFMKFPKVPDVLKEAATRGVGVVAMKTLAGAKEIKLDPGDEPFPHAAFKWVLKHQEVAGLIVSIRNLTELQTYVEASGKAYTEKSARTLEKYRVAVTKEYCRTGCGDCLPACPEGVNIAGILRQRMYFKDYGQEKRAMTEYAAMSPNAGVCAECSDAPCANACPYDLDVWAQLADAHEVLRFTT